ncbi:MAG: DinB family protein [Acidobacteria bacterium]|nr:DinB family protein [Acidobacteriota bacterium]
MPKKKKKREKARQKARQRKGSPARVDADKALRQHLLYLLRGGGAHLDFGAGLRGLPADLRGVKPAGAPHTAWQLLEHMRIAQWDILEFSRNPKHVSPGFPDGYWPETQAPPDPAAWEKSLAAFRADLKAMQDLVADPATDLYARIPQGTGQTILREALLVADHNAYHLGQLVLLRRLLGAWPTERTFSI